MKVSVVIPCYNELLTVDQIVAAIRSGPIPDVQIILVDDCSTDGTREFLQRKPPGWVDKILYHEKNRGKGGALRTGLRHLTGDFVIIQDADLEYDPREYPLLLDPLLSGHADVVFGSRFMGGRPHRVVYFWHMVGNRLLTLFSNMLTNVNLTDMETCYKAFRREAIDSLSIEEERFGCEPEIVAKAARAKLRLYEVGISYHGRTYEQGKKIGWRDGLGAIRAILKYNLFR